MARVTIHWNGYSEVIHTEFSFKCIGGIAWITPVLNGETSKLGALPYPYTSIEVERCG